MVRKINVQATRMRWEKRASEVCPQIRGGLARSSRGFTVFPLRSIEHWSRYAVSYHEYLACEVDRVETGPRCHGCRILFYFFLFSYVISRSLLCPMCTGRQVPLRQIYHAMYIHRQYRYFDWIETIYIQWSDPAINTSQMCLLEKFIWESTYELK